MEPRPDSNHQHRVARAPDDRLHVAVRGATRVGVAPGDDEHAILLGHLDHALDQIAPPHAHTAAERALSLFGDLHVHGMEGVYFYTRTKAVTTRWVTDDVQTSAFHMPTLGGRWWPSRDTPLSFSTVVLPFAGR